MDAIRINFKCIGKKVSFILCFSCFFSLLCKSQEEKLNLSFETIDSSLLPKGWRLGTQNNFYIFKIDSTTYQQGKYSLSIAPKVDSINSDGIFGVCSNTITAKYSGSKIKLTGYLKTKDVQKGFAGLLLRIDGKLGVIGFDNMQSRGIQGTTEWKKYTIELPYKQNEAKSIMIGALLTGSGSLWVDHLELFIDGKQIESVPLKQKPVEGSDTLYENSSKVNSIELNSSKIKMLTNLGMIWGFLKYYHPDIAAGIYNWDAELFKILPKLLSQPGNDSAYSVIEHWVDDLRAVSSCKNCSELPIDKIKLNPDYGYLFLKDNLPTSLVGKLINIRNNYAPPSNHYYISFTRANSPIFQNEKDYLISSYPDAGIRLLALYRYWNTIQYFYPNRHLIGKDWNEILPEFIPRFIDAENSKEYAFACIELIARINDTHANVSDPNRLLDSLKGTLITPFKAIFVENKLVVSNYYKNGSGVKDKIGIGDIIERIDGISVDSLIKKYLPFSPASNYETQLRDLPSSRGYLLRSNEKFSHFTIRRNGEENEVVVERIPLAAINTELDYTDVPQTNGYKLLSDSIGFIYPAKLKEDDLTNVQKEFNHTKGIVIDLRCYPSVPMAFIYGQWLKNEKSPFVLFSRVNLIKPGSVLFGDEYSNGKKPGKNTYNGKVVIIVNSMTQSQAEYVVMALGESPNAKVIGSTTAGADGNISTIVLPGGILTAISGIGVLYPNGKETQRIGVNIDIFIKPTLKGILEGKDELLEKAIQIINSN